MSQTSKLLELPVDLQVMIIPQLTSTALISLSQTNRHFRGLIDPQRRDFVQRLLQLECLPENGGEVLRDAHTFFPETIRYACTHCLKLLPHTSFDNHAIWRLRSRKPPPHANEALKLCGWVGGDAKARGLKRQADAKRDTLDNWLAGGADRDLWVIGRERRKRKCNECKFQTGFWANNLGMGLRNQNIGTAGVPVVKSRQRAHHDMIERYLPGLFPYDSDDYPLIRKIYRTHHMTVENYANYSVRCPGCSTWQEFAAFREPRYYKFTPTDSPQWRMSGWDGPHFERYRCNRCVARTSGTDELEKQLRELWTQLAESEIRGLEHTLEDGWRYLGNAAERGNKQLQAVWEMLVRSAEFAATGSMWFKRLPYQCRNGRDHSKSDCKRSCPPRKLHDVELLDSTSRRKCFEMWKQYWNDNGFDILNDLKTNPWFKQWYEGYNAAEKRLHFLEACNKTVEANPGILVEYALGPGAPETDQTRA